MTASCHRLEISNRRHNEAPAGARVTQTCLDSTQDSDAGSGPALGECPGPAQMGRGQARAQETVEERTGWDWSVSSRPGVMQSAILRRRTAYRAHHRHCAMVVDIQPPW
jgi:hypothetical protein